VYIENFLMNHLVKKFLKNWSTLAKVTIKHQGAYFFLEHGVYIVAEIRRLYENVF